MSFSSINPVTLGILGMLLAYLMFALADSTTKYAVLLGVPVFQLAFLRYGVHLGISTTESAFRGLNTTVIKQYFWLLILRGLLLATSTVGNFYALKYLPLSMYSAIMFSAPIFLCLISWPLLGERVGVWRWSAIILGFVGVLVILRPFADDFHISGLATLYAALALAVYSILTRKMAGDVPPHVMQVSTGTLGTVLLLPLAIMYWEEIGLSIFLMMLWVGFASWAGHELLTRAHKLADASILMPYSYSMIIYMTITGYLFYQEVPDALTILGTIIIVAAGLLIWHREKQVNLQVVAADD